MSWLTGECEDGVTTQHSLELAWNHVGPFGCIRHPPWESAVCMCVCVCFVITIHIWHPWFPAGFSTRQRLREIWLFVYHLNKCQRSALGQMDAEQTEFTLRLPPLWPELWVSESELIHRCHAQARSLHFSDSSRCKRMHVVLSMRWRPLLHTSDLVPGCQTVTYGRSAATVPTMQQLWPPVTKA